MSDNNFGEPSPPPYAPPLPPYVAVPSGPRPIQPPTVVSGGPNPETPPVWGAPAPLTSVALDADGRPTDGTGAPARKKMSTVAKSLTAVGVAAVIAVGGTIAVTSANAANSSSSQQAGPGGGGFGGEQGGFGGATRGGSGLSVIGSALHGEFVVADGSTTITERIQTGAVTAVSSTSLTVKSTDDFSATYVIGSWLDVSGFPTGTNVTVVAKVSGTTVTATSVTAARTATTGGAGTGSTDGTGSTGGTGDSGGQGTPPGGGQGGPGSTGDTGSTGGTTDSGTPTV